MTTRVLIVDDHAVVRAGLRALLETEPDLQVVGEAADGREAVDRTLTLKPDVVLMDLVMPRMGGIAAIREIRSKSAGIKVIALTSFGDDGRVLEAVQAGVDGYLLKDCRAEELLGALRSVAVGGAHLEREVTLALMRGLRANQRTRPQLDELTPRETEVLREIASGRSNKEIARKLGIKEKTVKTHVSNVLSKLGVHDRTQAALEAVKSGLIGLG